MSNLTGMAENGKGRNDMVLLRQKCNLIAAYPRNTLMFCNNLQTPDCSTGRRVALMSL